MILRRHDKFPLGISIDLFSMVGCPPVVSQFGLLTQSERVTRAGRFIEYSQLGLVIQPDRYSLGATLLSLPKNYCCNITGLEKKIFS